MQKEQLTAHLRQIAKFMKDNAAEAERLASQQSDFKSLNLLLTNHAIAESMLRRLLTAYVEGDPEMGELLQERFFEIELSLTLQQLKIG